MEILHEKAEKTDAEELYADFMSLIATFSGRLYGIRSRETRQRLLDNAQQKLDKPNE